MTSPLRDSSAVYYNNKKIVKAYMDGQVVYRGHTLILEDDFASDSASRSKWSGYGDPSTAEVGVSGGVLNIVCNTDWRGVWTPTRAGSLNSRVQTQMVAVPSGNTSAIYNDTYLGLEFGAAGQPRNVLSFDVENNNTVNAYIGIADAWTVVFTMTYTPGLWFRIDTGTNNASWYTSTDGKAWTLRATYANIPFSLDSMYVFLGTGADGSNQGTAKFDNFLWEQRTP